MRQQAIAALQAALAAEQAASYGYGIVGAHLTGYRFTAASADCVEHERARDALTRLITARGGTPRPAAAAYQLPVAVSTPAQAAALAVILEHRVTAAYLGLAAVTDKSLRSLAAGQMQACAVRAARWGGHSQAFPGLPASSAKS
jgi:Domain of unknown function (DUF4439)